MLLKLKLLVLVLAMAVCCNSLEINELTIFNTLHGLGMKKQCSKTKTTDNLGENNKAWVYNSDSVLTVCYEAKYYESYPGATMQINRYQPDGKLISYSFFTYNEKGEIIKIVNGAPQMMNETIYMSVIYCDGEGKKYATDNYDNGRKYGRTTFQYLEHSMVEKNYYFPDTIHMTEMNQHILDSLNQVIRKNHYTLDSTTMDTVLSGYVTRDYDTQGNMIRELRYSDALYQTVLHAYEGSRMMKIELFDSLNSLTSYALFEYEKTPTVIDENTGKDLEVVSVYPNPFNPTTKFSINCGKLNEEKSTIEIYNATGRMVARLRDGSMSNNTMTYSWDASSEPSGVFMCRIIIGNKTYSKRITLIK